MKIMKFLALTTLLSILFGFSWNSDCKNIIAANTQSIGVSQETQEIDYIGDSDKGFSKLEKLIDESQYNIYISMYTLTNNKLIEKLRSPKHPSRQTFIILDYNEAQKCNDYKKLIGVKNVYIKLKKKLTKKGKIGTFYKYHKKLEFLMAKQSLLVQATGLNTALK